MFSKLFLGLYVQIVLVLSQDKEDSSDAEFQRRQDIIQERDNLQTLLKTLHYSCIVLARFQLSSYNSDLVDLLKSYSNPKDQELIWQKLYTSHVLKCQKTVTYEESVQVQYFQNILNLSIKVFTKIKQDDFEFAKYSYIFNESTIEPFKNIPSDEIVLTAEDEKIWKYIQDFEKSMDDKKREKEEEENLLNTIKPIMLNRDLKIFGLSVDVSPRAQLIVLVIFFFGLGLSFKIFFSRVTQQNDKKKRRGKKV